MRNNDRVNSIDIMRGSAIVTLMLCHCVIFLSALDGQHPWVFFFSNHIIGDFGAPVYYFLAGMSQALVYERRKSSGYSKGLLTRGIVERGIVLILLGVLLSILSKGPSSVPRWDTLHFIGISFLILSLLKDLPSWFILSVAGAAVVSAPFLRGLSSYSEMWVGGFSPTMPLNTVLPGCLYDPVGEYSAVFSLKAMALGVLSNAYFPLCPWLAFPLLGFVEGRRLSHRKAGSDEELPSWRWLGGAMACWAIGWILVLVGRTSTSTNLVTSFLAPFSFYPPTPAMFLMQCGVLITSYVLSCNLFDRAVVPGWRAWYLAYCRRSSRYSLSIYFLQILILGWVGMAAQTFLRSKTVGESTAVLSEPVALAFAVVFSVLLYPLLGLWDRVQSRYSFEWILERVIPSRRALAEAKRRLAEAQPSVRCGVAGSEAQATDRSSVLVVTSLSTPETLPV